MGAATIVERLQSECGSCYSGYGRDISLLQEKNKSSNPKILTGLLIWIVWIENFDVGFLLIQ